MIRLQPQAERLQKDIQDLREELEIRQRESQEEIRRLHQAAAQINQLNSQVQRAEKEQEILTVERLDAEEGAVASQQSEIQAAEAQRVLADELAEVREEHEQQLRALARAESESHRGWEKLEDATMQSSDLCIRLQMMGNNLEDLSQKSEESHEASIRLRGCWQEAVQLASLERGQVTAVNVQIGQLRDHGAIAECQAANLCDEAVETETAASELWQDIAKVEGQDHRRDSLVAELRSAQAEHEELRCHIFMQEEYDSELLASLNESEAQRATVSQQLQVDAVRWEEIKSNIRETQFMASRLYTELTKHSEGHGSVRRRHSVMEEAGRDRLMKLRGQHDQEATEARSLENKASELLGESQELEKDISTTQRQKENLTSTLATREQQHQAQLVRKEELNSELEELKKQWRCSIS